MSFQSRELAGVWAPTTRATSQRGRLLLDPRKEREDAGELVGQPRLSVSHDGQYAAG